jgi:hypothetical protein
LFFGVLSARQVGALLVVSKTAAIVEGNVVAIAIALRPATIVTSDVHDVTHLLKSAKIPYALFGARVPAAAQVIIIYVCILPTMAQHRPTQFCDRAPEISTGAKGLVDAATS